jgi:2-polyprenyl-6-methoxyphenol hydroxylase-like FAD-dependent oxidoreductase
MAHLSTRCCIAGGGPAGLMLGLLLARAGVEVVVLEKHADFLRDFRGDTIHPSTLEVMHELGFLDDLLQLPHQKVSRVDAQFGETVLPFADLSHLPTHCKFIALMPQWDFLNFLADRAARTPTFKLVMPAEVTDLLMEGGRCVGVRAETADGPLDVRAELVVGADGRQSTVRARAGLHVDELGAPMDVLWFRLSRLGSDPAGIVARFDVGRLFVMLNRTDYWQCAYVIPKGTAGQLRKGRLEDFRASVAALAPFAKDRVTEIATWDDAKLLTVRVDWLPCWYRPGLLCIGDAAHAMSPVGGVGINLAIQDAVAAANILAQPLRNGRVTTDHLRRVQRRRTWPTRMTQRLQLFMQDKLIAPVLGSRRQIAPPLPFRLLRRFPVLRRLPARLIGMGFRPEHVRSPEIQGSARSRL